VAVQLSGIEFDLSRALHPPAGGYSNAVRHGNLLYLAGHGPLLDGRPTTRGKVPDEVSVEEARAAARLTAINCLATIEHALGSLDDVTRIVKLLGMVNAAPEFAEHPAVLDGASELLLEVFGPDVGTHARSAVGMASLPFGIPVEVEMIVAVR
jgi:enamine deaminase RidA (YjgF/YER057c/UK114 family)